MGTVSPQSPLQPNNNTPISAASVATTALGECTEVFISRWLPNTVNPYEILYSGDMILTTQTGSITGPGRVILETHNGPTIRWEMTFTFVPGQGSPGGEGEVELNGYSINPPKAKVLVINSAVNIPAYTGSASGLVQGDDTFEIITATKPGSTTGRPESVGWLTFYVLNLRPFKGSSISALINGKVKSWNGRTTFSFGPWQVTLDAMPDAEKLLTEARAIQGFAVTHVGRLQRLDNKLFEVGGKKKSGQANAKAALEALYYYLAFVNGSECGILMPTGRRRQAPYVFWEEWSGNITTRADWYDSWFCYKMHASYSFSSAECFYKVWNNPDSREWLQRGIGLYLACNRSDRAIDLSLTTAQTALELLSWVAMMEVNNLMSEDAFERLTAADRLRTLLFWMKVPTTIPPEQADLKSAFPDADAPKAVTELRNWLIHPTKKNRDNTNHVGLDPIIDAWHLNMWFIEMTLLRLIEYNGPYSVRFANPSGRPIPVPWYVPPASS